METALVIALIVLCLIGTFGIVVILASFRLQDIEEMDMQKKLVWERPRIESIGEISEGCENEYFYCVNGNKNESDCNMGHKHRK